MKPLAVSEAANLLGIHEARVRALIAAGELEAVKVGGRWLLDEDTIARRERQGSHPGRPFEAHNAWALILLASGAEPAGYPPSVLWRLRQLLSHEGLFGLRQRMRRRGEAQRYVAHPGELRYLEDDPDLVPSGISAARAHGLDLAAGDEFEAYVSADELSQVVKEHALAPAERGEANVVLRAVPAAAWVLGGQRIAPHAAVALDLAESPDARSARAGVAALHSLDKQRKSDR
jgi:excisionase family DNA binding protein